MRINSVELFEEFPILLINEHYYLREPRVNDQDAQGYYDCYNDPKVKIYIPDECIPESVEKAKQDLGYLWRLFTGQQSFFWVIARRDNDEVIGNIGFHEWNAYHNRAEIAYELNSRYWRQGIVGKAATLVIDFAFNKMRVSRIQANTVTYNVPSKCLLKKTGFTEEGVLSKYKFYKGEYIDIVMFGYSNEQYQLNKTQKLVNLRSIQQNYQRNFHRIYNYTTNPNNV